MMLLRDKCAAERDHKREEDEKEGGDEREENQRRIRQIVTPLARPQSRHRCG